MTLISKQDGMTLMEMVLVVAIILILASVGLVSYSQMRQRSYNAGAQHVAVQIQKTQGVHHTNNKEWATNLDQLLAIDKNILDTPNVTIIWLGSNSSGYTINVKHTNGSRWYTASQQ